MDKKELMAAIDRVRRVMGRNADVMLICDYAQGELTRPVLQSVQVAPNEATASPARRGGARPGAGRKPTGKALSAAERSKRHRDQCVQRNQNDFKHRAKEVRDPFTGLPVTGEP